MTYGSMAGIVSGSGPLSPSLPAATTTVMPARQALCTAWASGSSAGDWAESVPYDRLSTSMLWLARCSTTQSMPAMTCETSTPPSAVPTFTLTSRASGAMPTKCLASFSPPTGVALSRPAIRPAMCVPCP